jgi:hypothetical protein
MNITKNQWIVIGIVGAIAVWYFFLRKKDETKESGYREGSINYYSCLYKLAEKNGGVNTDDHRKTCKAEMIRGTKATNLPTYS